MGTRDRGWQGVEDATGYKQSTHLKLYPHARYMLLQWWWWGVTQEQVLFFWSLVIRWLWVLTAGDREFGEPMTALRSTILYIYIYTILNFDHNIALSLFLKVSNDMLFVCLCRKVCNSSPFFIIKEMCLD